MPQTMPVLFLGHGSPMNAIEDNAWTRQWRELAKRLPRPEAVLCVSAHWQTPGVRVGGAARPRTIHDFGGFPRPLYEVQYPAPGEPALARRVAALLDPQLEPAVDPDYGLDHGAWQVLLHLFPQADVPVVQLSLDLRRPGPQHYAIARMLSPLREEGVLIVGSGNIVHNLRELDFRDPDPPQWAEDFRDLVNGLIAEGRHAELADYPALANARQAVPSPDHYLPLLYALALGRPGEPLEIFNDDVYSTLSMTSLAIGLEAVPARRH